PTIRKMPGCWASRCCICAMDNWCRLRQKRRRLQGPRRWLLWLDSWRAERPARWLGRIRPVGWSERGKEDESEQIDPAAGFAVDDAGRREACRPGARGPAG